MNLEIIQDISRYKEWTKITVPMYGSSQNMKYRVKDISGNDYILRVSDISLFNDKKQEYDNIMRLSQNNILMPKPIDFGTCNGGKNVYMLLTWIDGVAVEDVISNLEENLQYQLGYSSGRLLREIHNCSKVASKLNWGTVYEKNIEKVINEYKNTGISIHHEQKIMSYIYSYKHLLNGRPQVIRHGDFHVGKLIITPDKEIGVIDFDKCDIGDGWEEFGGIVWAARLSEGFAKGQIDGYFSDQVPDEFFKLLALYIGVYTLEHVARSVSHNQDKISIKSIYSNTDFMTKMFGNYSTYIPNWYRK
ncbi:phosphotransferase [Clostridium sp. 19966]|uniref:aminoglycoside phosphotransferase family protein n=1 Tax=Clostridium sp. 19966 TaxID=2768166 RepID=UPI0028DE8EAC|nr:phosphotransferase [Clostridium sp. 19966]MDT8718459.1 phosphotransferase [Clostridium sp. 19966]